MNTPPTRRYPCFPLCVTGFFAVTAIAAVPLDASLVVELAFLDLHQRAETIVHGRCIAKKEVPGGKPLPYTEYTFEVLKAAKGCRDAAGKLLERITFRHAGTQHGMKQDDGTETAPLRLGLPEHRVGEEAVLFLTREGRSGLCAPVGLAQGKFDVKRKDGRAFVVNARGKKFFGDLKASAFLALEAREAQALESGDESIDLECFLGLCGKAKTK